MTTQDLIKQQIQENPVMLYMKGTPQFPQCGFSSAAVKMLKELSVKFASVNVLENPEIRQGIKEFSNWPTIPQLYINGQFIGGSDIMSEMFESGELQELVKQLA
ncbi:MAG: Grx4 family monothiol glutaredoxin [Pseudomonadota bacterium]